MAWLTELETAKARAVAQETEPWATRLERARGHIGDDGIERLTTQALLDMLEVPQRARRPGTFRRLARVMTELGWTPVRVRGLTRGGYLEQVRGYCRDARVTSQARPVSAVRHRATSQPCAVLP
jgi:hypothetical protein